MKREDYNDIKKAVAALAKKDVRIKDALYLMSRGAGDDPEIMSNIGEPIIGTTGLLPLLNEESRSQTEGWCYED